MLSSASQTAFQCSLGTAFLTLDSSLLLLSWAFCLHPRARLIATLQQCLWRLNSSWELPAKSQNSTRWTELEWSYASSLAGSIWIPHLLGPSSPHWCSFDQSCPLSVGQKALGSSGSTDLAKGNLSARGDSWPRWARSGRGGSQASSESSCWWSLRPRWTSP